MSKSSLPPQGNPAPGSDWSAFPPHNSFGTQNPLNHQSSGRQSARSADVAAVSPTRKDLHGLLAVLASVLFVASAIIYSLAVHYFHSLVDALSISPGMIDLFQINSVDSLIDMGASRFEEVKATWTTGVTFFYGGLVATLAGLVLSGIALSTRWKRTIPLVLIVLLIAAPIVSVTLAVRLLV